MNWRHRRSTVPLLAAWRQTMRNFASSYIAARTSDFAPPVHFVRPAKFSFSGPREAALGRLQPAPVELKCYRRFRGNVKFPSAILSPPSATLWRPQ
jgi:hypothetical protein